MEEQVLIKNVSDTIKFVKLAAQIKLDKDRFWFRGQSSLEYKLLPASLRDLDNNEIYSEPNITCNFVARFPEIRVQYKTEFEQLCIMQHHGLPTRTLDWTTNILIALYFAAKNEDNNDGALYVLDTGKLSTVSMNQTVCYLPDSIYVSIRSNQSWASTKEELLARILASNLDVDKEKLSKMIKERKSSILPIPVLPHYNTRRIAVQNGTMVLFGGKNYSKTEANCHKIENNEITEKPISLEELNAQQDQNDKFLICATVKNKNKIK